MAASYLQLVLYVYLDDKSKVVEARVTIFDTHDDLRQPGRRVQRLILGPKARARLTKSKETARFNLIRSVAPLYAADVAVESTWAYASGRLMPRSFLFVTQPVDMCVCVCVCGSMGDRLLHVGARAPYVGRTYGAAVRSSCAGR